MKGVNMGNAAIEKSNDTSEPTNQNTDTQIYIPSQRETISSAVNLFSKYTTGTAQNNAQEYLEEQLKSVESLKIGTFLIGLLEKLDAIPTEIAVEDSAHRENAVNIVEQLLLDIDEYTDSAGKFMRQKFSEEVVDTIRDEELDTYPIIQLLQKALSKARLAKQSIREEKLISTQRVVLLGITKEIRANT